MAAEENDPYQYRARVRRRGFPAQTKTSEKRKAAEAWGRTIPSYYYSRGKGLAKKLA